MFNPNIVNGEITKDTSPNPFGSLEKRLLPFSILEKFPEHMLFFGCFDRLDQFFVRLPEQCVRIGLFIDIIFDDFRDGG